MGTSVTRRTTKTTGLRFITKSLNVRSTADPIMMFGGSPMSVAVPPMLEAKISLNRKG